MSDRMVWLLASSCWLAAMIAVPIPWLIGAVVLAAGWLSERAPVVVIGCVLLATALAANAWAGLVPVASGAFAGTATLADDPRPQPGGISVDLRVDGNRVQARAWGSAAGGLRNRLLGEQVTVVGTLRPPTRVTPWSASRGITGSMTVTSVGRWKTGRVHHRIANSVRRTIESGAASLSNDRRSLLTGFVYGDDRHQSALTADAFRAAGLTHLLAVSGQNVAFVLVIFGPVLRRFDYRGRFVLTLGVLVLFATITRFEASVLRASVMAAVAALATVAGRDAAGKRVLALAVVALVLLDPLIVHSLAFQLSVAASAGILVLAPFIADQVPGPRVWREAIGVTSGAQLAVAPLIILTFGGLPVVSLPANILAGPAAGPVMMWGLTGGTLAGSIARPLATIIHLPTNLLLGWVSGVAEVAAKAPLGDLGLSHLAAIAGALAVMGFTHNRPARRACVALIGCALIAPAITLALSADRSFPVDEHTHIWRDENVTVLVFDPATDPADIFEKLRKGGVRSIDLIVVTRGGWAASSMVRDLEDRFQVTTVWAAEQDRLPGAEVVREPIGLRVGPTTLTITPHRDGMSVAVRAPGPVGGG